MFKAFWITTFLWVSAAVSSAHELTPTYPEIKESHVEGVYVVTLETLNRRQDVEYFELAAYDKDMEPMEFAARERVFKLPYTSRKTLKVYVREADVKRLVYICTRSKMQRSRDTNKNISIVSSKVCSKLK